MKITKRKKLKTKQGQRGRGYGTLMANRLVVLTFVFCYLTSLKARAVHYMMPVDSHAFVTEWKGKHIDGKSTTLLLELLKLYFGFAAIVEQVREGTTLRVRLLMPDGEHQMVNIALAGVKSARASSKQGESSEPYGEEVSSRSLLISPYKFLFLRKAKYYTESRLLQRPVRVQILSLPNSAAIPFQNAANAAAPPPASIFIGTGKAVSI